MKSTIVRSLIVSAVLGLMLLSGIGATTADAQRRGRNHGPVIVYRPFRPLGWGWRDPFWYRTYTVVDPIAQARESGYSDGHKRGKDDAKDGKLNSPESHKHYRDSDSQTYRQAFLQGYADGYNERNG
jgi:hypothetical protein